MIKNGMAVLILALIATLAHADDYLSPTNETRPPIAGLHVPVIDDQHSIGQQWWFARHVDQRGERAGPGEIRLRTQISGHGAGRRAATGCASTIFTLDRTGNATLSAPIVFRDVVLQIGDPVQTNLSMRTPRHHLRILVHPPGKVRARRNFRHQRHGRLGPRTRVHPRRGM